MSFDKGTLSSMCCLSGWSKKPGHSLEAISQAKAPNEARGDRNGFLRCGLETNEFPVFWAHKG